MKKVFAIIFLCVLSISFTLANPPHTISYQAVIRNAQGNLIQDKDLGVRISIITDEETGVSVYSEERTTKTNQNGLIAFAIGDGNGNNMQSIEDIDWSTGGFYILCEIDLNGGTNYTLSLTTPLTTVPYALYAEKISKAALPEWVFEDQKPTYNYSEIQGAPIIPTKLSELKFDIEIPEQKTTDSTFLKSVAFGITASDTARWNTKEIINVPTKTSELTNDNGFITLNEVPTVTIPTKVSELANDSQFITANDIPTVNVPTKTSQLTNDNGFITLNEVPTVTVPTKISELQNDQNFVTADKLPTKTSQLTNDNGYITLNEVPTVTIPTKVSELANDSQFITANDIPTVNVPTKTSQLTNDNGFITLNEVPTVTVPTKVSELTNDSQFITANDIPTVNVPTKTSQLQNDNGFITLNEVPTVTVPTKVSELTNDSQFITAEDIPTVNVPTKTSQLTNDNGFITLNEVPTKVSEFENDALYITKAQLDDILTKIEELKTKNSELQTAIEQLQNTIGSQTFKRTAVNTYKNFSMTDFNDASTVYHSLKEGDRIIFIIRHSKRNDDSSFGSKLTAEGIQMARSAGAKLQGGLAGINDSYYGSTAYPRCKETSYYIANSRGDTEPKDTTSVHAPIDVVLGNYFTENTKWPYIAQYYENHISQANDKAIYMINTLCELTEGKTFSWFTSHDFTTLILTEWATDHAIKFVSPNWINYLTGVAVIVHPDKSWEVYPVKNLASGYNTAKGDYSTWW
ncbi:MAG: hypothetical protein MJ204_03820 [Bacteroidales bacterium]|nr:hypothetical protein [Bacteroidales bacterium]